MPQPSSLSGRGALPCFSFPEEQCPQPQTSRGEQCSQPQASSCFFFGLYPADSRAPVIWDRMFFKYKSQSSFCSFVSCGDRPCSRFLRESLLIRAIKFFMLVILTPFLLYSPGCFISRKLKTENVALIDKLSTFA